MYKWHQHFERRMSYYIFCFQNHSYIYHFPLLFAFVYLNIGFLTCLKHFVQLTGFSNALFPHLFENVFLLTENIL